MLYDYLCDNCGHEIIDYYQSIKEDAITKCPQCNCDSLNRVIYGGVAHFVKDVTTIGQIADKNWQKLGQYKRSELEAEHKEKNNTNNLIHQHGKASKKEIVKMTEKQKEKYIITGEK